LLGASYASFSAAAYRHRLARLKERRNALVALCVKRANMMPALMSAARKRSPVPEDIYNRFAQARDDFARAKTDAEFKEANQRLDTVFNDFLAHYEGFASAEYIKVCEDLDAVNEKIAFERTFFGEASANFTKVKGGPLKAGIIIWDALDDAFKSIGRSLKKWGSKWTTTTQD
jgi:hypothetical protein